MHIDSPGWRETVVDGAAVVGVALTPDQAAAIGRHAREMIAWNRVTNLTAITDPLAVAVKHAVDSLAAAPWIHAGARVLDAGSGGGYPGIPLKIARPDLSFTLVDSVRKKVSFLTYAIGALGLDGIRAVHARLEALAHAPAFAGQFDCVVCRAFASLADFAALALPFLAPGGSLLAMKGPQAEHDHELDDAADGDRIVIADTPMTLRIHRYRLPVLGDRRRLIRLTPE
jgi:16S rRNA (guanine527-N7)-methyltransferase